MYRLLEENEIIEKGDEYYHTGDKVWIEDSSRVGTLFYKGQWPIRRKIKKKVKKSKWTLYGEKNPTESGWHLVQFTSNFIDVIYYDRFANSWNNSRDIIKWRKLPKVD